MGKLYRDRLCCVQLSSSALRDRDSFSLDLPVYVRGVGPADGTSAIGLQVVEHRGNELMHNNENRAIR